MIQTSAIEKNSVLFQVLTDDQVLEIRRASYDVMSKVGFNVLHAGARKMLKQAGCQVKGEHVNVPEHVVNACLNTAPKGYTIYNRDGSRAMEVEGRKSYYGTSTASPNTMDALTGEIHPTYVVDIANGAKVADALEHIDWVMPMGSVQDVPPTVADLYEFEAVVTHTTKPIVFIGYTPKGVELVYEMAAEVAGGLENLQAKPFLIFYPEPISPLVQPEDVIDRLFISADLNLPQMQGPSIQFGATAPVTLAGGIVQGTAESLMCLVLAQLRNPGCPCSLGSNFSVLDMSSGLTSIACPEMSLALAAQAEVALSFGLPTWGLAGATGAKVLDAQAGAESAFSILAQGLGSLNLIHDVGYMDDGMVCSAAQLVMGNENIGMTKRFVRGIEINREMLAREVIENVGPGGHYLSETHTLRHFKDEFWRPGLMARGARETWLQEGSKNMMDVIQEKLHAIIETHAVPAIADKTLSAIRDIRNKGEKLLVKN
ncbi:MAG: trimethylamine methyltransferase family protein [Deltaproteobacteria bacterium]|nr:trimethylamine methyltransferase family protein [Deltaproteobacteria bacterium]MBW2678070.1 trimethylamine methyltransferase family protein [Deltaproteobacteria bacterium]